MNKFIYQIDKEELKDCIKLSFFYLNELKQTNKEEISVPYSIFLSKEDYNKLNITSENIIITKKDLKNKNNEEIYKVEINSKELYEYLLSQIREIEGKTYEQDLIREHLYLIENNLPVFEQDEGWEVKFKYISIDIETIYNSKGEENIVMISIHSPDKKGANKVYVDISKLKSSKLNAVNGAKFKEFDIEVCQNEKELLEKFRDDVISYEPQVILGWNVIDFDFRAIRDRMKFYKIDFKFSKYGKECKLRINADFFKDSSMACSGTLIFDAIQLLKSNFISFEDYKLNTVAKEILKDEKIDLQEENEEGDTNKLEAIKNLLENDPIKLIEYNFKDSLLVSKIVEKLNLLQLMIKRSIVTDTPIQKVKSPIATLDIMYLKELHKKNYVALSNFNYNVSTPIEGAFVVEPKKGFYEDIFVLDFKSLYPSIIMTFNVDPFTFNEKGEILAPNGARFDNHKGILPELILKLYKERDIAKKEKDEIKSYALKTTMNSFYGAMASPKCRLYNKEVGGAITSFARFIIQKAKKYVEDLGHNVIYGDTDSIFIKLNQDLKNIDEKKRWGKKLEDELNQYFKGWVNKEFKQENYLKIEHEKIYSKFFIASKKRYVGYDQFTSKTQFVGMEAIRGDWTELAKNFQIKLVKLIFEEGKQEEIKDFIKKEVEKLKEGKYDELLVYKKKITKPLSEYTKTTPPHVKAARELKEFNGRVVKYVLTTKGPKHISLFSDLDELDYEHYIEKQLKGVSDDLLESLDIDFDEIINNKKQKSLDRFF